MSRADSDEDGQRICDRGETGVTIARNEIKPEVPKVDIEPLEVIKRNDGLPVSARSCKGYPECGVVMLLAEVYDEKLYHHHRYVVRAKRADLPSCPHLLLLRIPKLHPPFPPDPHLELPASIHIDLVHPKSLAGTYGRIFDLVVDLARRDLRVERPCLVIG